MELYPFDEQYVQRLQAGVPETQHHFVAYFRELIFIKGRSRSLPRDFMEDICQETFLRVLSSLRRGDVLHPERLGAFVNSVCNNVMLEQYRSSNRAENMDADFDVPDKSIDLDRALVSQQAQRQVEEILARMKERDRRLLRAVFLEELDKDQVCKQYGVDRTYLRVLLHRAKQQFRSLMPQGRRPEGTVRSKV